MHSVCQKMLALPWFAAEEACASTIGGQAVMEGVMMRNGEFYSLAVRRPDGSIVVERRPWFSLTRSALLRTPFIRGFPTLLETMVNGIKALNRSAEFEADQSGEELKGWHIALSLGVALLMAVVLFVAVPHLFSLGMNWLGLGGDIDGLSFHIWDGFFKFAIFVGYILCISALPEIRRVFQYHGAEHKSIHAFESGDTISNFTAQRCNRLHPRCGTTFLLFVLSLAIILHAIFVPLLMLFWIPESTFIKHSGIILFKLGLMIPISALAYELIRFAARLPQGLGSTLLQSPGMFLQRLTTHEPDSSQIDVALAALHSALGDAVPSNFESPRYTVLKASNT